MKKIILSVAILVIPILFLIVSTKVKLLKNYSYCITTPYNFCPACGDTMATKNSCAVYYKKDGIISPFCQECFDRLSVDEIQGYVTRTLDAWKKDHPGNSYNGMTYDEIFENAMKEVKRRKGA